MKYLLDVDIRPKEHYIHVKGSVKDFASTTFYLNESFKILSASANGKSISWRFDMDAPHPPFDIVSRPITFDTHEREVFFEYEGYIPQIIANINQVDEDIVELASYSGWYPKPGVLSEFFDFELHMPFAEGYEVAANGSVCGDTIVGTQQFDIAIFASTKVKRASFNKGAATFTFLCPEEMLSAIPLRAEELDKANVFFEDKFGGIIGESASEIISIFRPRGGWGYKRGNVSYMSHEWGKTQARFKDDFHELAHGWWSIADVSTNDWINEGGAEFSAYAAAKSIYGDAYADELMQGYIDQIKGSTGTETIVETTASSNDRYLNHYIKTAYMFDQACRRFGEQAVFDLLKKLYQKFAQTKVSATTDDFLQLCDGDMREFFRHYLYKKDWADA